MSDQLNRDKLISDFAVKDYYTGLPNHIRAISKFEGGLKEGREYDVDVMFPQCIMGKGDTWGLDEDTCALLTGLVKSVKPRVILETGTNKGRSTRAICEGLKSNGEGHIWTVDWDDMGLLRDGAIREDEMEYVTQVIGKTPDIYKEEPLCSLNGIEMAFLDGDHSYEGIKGDIEFVELHRAPICLVLVDNALDTAFMGINKFMVEYDKFRHFPLPTMSGLELIMMDR